MTNEDSWNVTVHSDNRMNRMTNIPNTGTYLAALDKTKHGLLICTATGGGLTQDHVYLCSADGTTLIDISQMISHTHTSSTDGGSFTSILTENSHVMDLLLTKTQDCQKAQWIQTFTSTGIFEDKIDGTSGERSIRLRPGVTSGSGATISYPHLKLWFGANSTFTTKLQIETATSIALHTGVGADDVTAADSNTRKYQAEVCTVTNNNWWLRTANGSANSASDTGTAISANRVAIQMKHFPTAGTPRVEMYIDAGTVFQKTSNIPTSSTTTDNNVVKHSVKNSTAADRPLLVYATRLSYEINDTWI